MNAQPSRQSIAASPAIPPNLTPALRLLLEGYDYARELGRDVWDFALAIDCLHHHGHSDSGLRWLTLHGLIHHAAEEPPNSHPHRAFHPENELHLTDRSCFVLTDAGAELVKKLGGETASGTQERLDPPHTPFWDPARRQLRLGSLLIKHFKQPAANQELILAAFQEENWPPRIDDPLPPTHGIDSKQRLHDTIQRLNSHHLNSVIRFRGDGSGRGVTWEVGAPEGHQGGYRQVSTSRS